jgi:SAM-dependent methyltransferase
LEPAEVERALRELKRVNLLLLGYRPVLRTVLPLVEAGPAEQVWVDLGTGSGEVAERVRRRAARRGKTVRVVGVDRQLGHLLVGRRWGVPQHRVVADAAHLPFRDGAADHTLSTLLFHHFGADANRRILAEMRRVARRSAVVVDLRRSRLATCLGHLLIPLTGAGPVTRHDGYVSLQAAWSRQDLLPLLPHPHELHHRFPFRFTLVLPPT